MNEERCPVMLVMWRTTILQLRKNSLTYAGWTEEGEFETKGFNMEEAHKNHSALLKAVKVTCLLPNSAQLK